MPQSLLSGAGCNPLPPQGSGLARDWRPGRRTWTIRASCAAFLITACVLAALSLNPAPPIGAEGLPFHAMPAAGAATGVPSVAPPADERSAAPDPEPSAGPDRWEAAPPPSRAATGSVAWPPPPVPARPAQPVRLRIPSIQVDAAVEAVGTTPEGAMVEPREWMQVAWFEPGYRPGEPGGAVIAGHLDSTTGPAVFWDVRKLAPGDRLLVDLADGSTLAFAVTHTELHSVSDVPLAAVFGPAAVPALNLITCDGAFDRGSMSYTKRLVVYSTLAAG